MGISNSGSNDKLWREFIPVDTLEELYEYMKPFIHSCDMSEKTIALLKRLNEELEDESEVIF